MRAEAGEPEFTLQYRDRFTAAALRAYSGAIIKHVHTIPEAQQDLRRQLMDYAEHVFAEAKKAQDLGLYLPEIPVAIVLARPSQPIA